MSIGYLILVLACSSISFILYCLTLAPGITWADGSADSGELATALYHWGVAHPTGYPLYTALGALFTHLPLGEVAHRTSLFSAVTGAATVAVMALYVSRLAAPLGTFPARAGGVLAAAMLACSPMFWSQAVVTEVYAFNTLLLMLVCVLLERAVALPPSARALLPVSLAGGVALSHHSTSGLVLAAAAARLLLVHRLWRVPVWRWLPWPVLGVVVVAALYLLLPLRAAVANPAAVWGGTSTLAGFLDHVTGAAYRGALFSLAPQIVVTKLPALARMLLDQFGPLGYLLMLNGMWWLWQHRRDLAIWWLAVVLLTVVFALDYTVLDSEIYLLPAFVLVAAALGVGFAALAAEVLARVGRRNTETAQLGLMAGAAALVAFSFAGGLARNHRANDREASTYAQAAFDTAAPNAVIFSSSDEQTFSLWYLQNVLGLRPDLRLIDTRLFTWPWYRARLPRQYPDLEMPADADLRPLRELDALVAANPGRVVYFTTPGAQPATEQVGNLWRMRPGG